MKEELLRRVHFELVDVLNSINNDKIHHDGDDFHELLRDVEEALAQPEERNFCPRQEPDYAYLTIEEYEEITGFKVNDTFRMGWTMARTTNDLFKQMEKNNG